MISEHNTSVLDSLSSYFKPEFLNRFDAIIEFNHLEKENLVKIVDLMLKRLTRNINRTKHYNDCFR